MKEKYVVKELSCGTHKRKAREIILKFFLDKYILETETKSAMDGWSLLSQEFEHTVKKEVKTNE